MSVAEINRDHLAVGLVLAVLTWLVIVRGIKSIGRAAEKLSPLKVGLYLVGGVIVIVTPAKLPACSAWCFSEAFSMQAAAGGAAGWSRHDDRDPLRCRPRRVRE